MGPCLVILLQKLVAADELPSILDLQRSYVEANGGLVNIQELSSLIASGHIKDAEGEAYGFKLIRKRPDKMRLQMSLPSVEKVTVCDGKQAFSVFSVRGSPDEIVAIHGGELSQLTAESSLDGPFFNLRSRPEWLQVVAEVDVDGALAYEILISEQANSSYERIWISKEHLQEVKLSRRIESEDGDRSLEEIYFNDFDKVKGIWLAKRIRYERDGQIYQTVEIDRVRVNVGISDSYFAVPENL